MQPPVTTSAPKSKAKGCLVGLLLLVGISWGVYECKYYFSYWSDLRDRPWAYASDPDTPLLVGKWRGSFQDPDGLTKTIDLEIIEPVTEKERSKRAGRRRSRRRHENRQAFDGFATVRGRTGTENYEIYGAVADKEGHQLNTIHFRSTDEKNRPRKSFNVHSSNVGGRWVGDHLRLTLNFVYITATGSGYSDSADLRYDRKAAVDLVRIRP